MHMYVQAKISHFCGWTNMVMVTCNVMRKRFFKAHICRKFSQFSFAQDAFVL